MDRLSGEFRKKESLLIKPLINKFTRLEKFWRIGSRIQIFYPQKIKRFFATVDNPSEIGAKIFATHLVAGLGIAKSSLRIPSNASEGRSPTALVGRALQGRCPQVRLPPGPSHHRLWVHEDTPDSVQSHLGQQDRSRHNEIQWEFLNFADFLLFTLFPFPIFNFF